VSPRPRRGFTLLEVLVALALLAMALAALADLAGGALRNHEFARDLDAAVLLARGRMAALEDHYEQAGFKDTDEEASGDFGDEGRPDVRWKALVLRPAADLSADELIARLAGQAGAKDATDLVSRILGQQATPSSGGGPVATTAGNPAVALVAAGLQAQLRVFGETLKRSVRELRLTVSWPSGRRTQSFTVTTHLVVLNPMAPGGAQGPVPDVPANLITAAAAGAQPMGTTVRPGQPAPGARR
jgi:general secretion pathway protein I